MPGRDVTAAMVTGLEAGTTRPVLIAYLDILTDPIAAWTGPGIFAPTGTPDPALNDRTFVSVAPFLDLSDIKEDMGIGGPTTIQIAGHDLDEEVLKQVVRDKNEWRGRKAYLWMGLLNADEYSVIAWPARIKTGVMTQMFTTRTPTEAVVKVEIDQDLGNAVSAPYRWVDHIRYWPADTWSTFVVALANKPEGFEALPTKPLTPLEKEIRRNRDIRRPGVRGVPR